jgi:hypothetical protein
MKALKINNPEYMGLLGPRIQEYAKKLAIPGFTYEGLFVYFRNVIRAGGEISEFWTVFDDNGEPLGFANWQLLGIPRDSTVSFTHYYIWDKRKAEVSDSIIQEFLNFKNKHNATFVDVVAQNQAGFKLFAKLFKEAGFDILENDRINFIARRQN